MPQARALIRAPFRVIWWTIGSITSETSICLNTDLITPDGRRTVTGVTCDHTVHRLANSRCSLKYYDMYFILYERELK